MEIQHNFLVHGRVRVGSVEGGTISFHVPLPTPHAPVGVVHHFLHAIGKVILLGVH